MTKRNKAVVLLGVGLLFGGLSAVAPAQAQAPAPVPDTDSICPNPVQAKGFKTCADIEKAEAEGTLVFYATDIESGTVKLLKEFETLYPKIKTSYIRLQAGALYSRLLAERQGKSYLADVFQIGDVGLVMDFQKRGGYARYVSPEMTAYKSAYKSEPEGHWTWSVLMPAGLAYNPNVTPADQAPKDWKDLLDPKWSGVVSMKSANSGMQHVTWYQIKEHVSDDYWEKFADLKPRAFDSMVQQFDRLVNGEDKVAMTAQYAAYLEFKAKGAPIAFVAPTTGLPSGPEVTGIVKEAPHPNAARLFLDWYLSPEGQKASVKYWYFHSPREDVAPPEGALPLSQMKLLFPADWEAYAKTRNDFLREMRSMSGLK
ncbi:ABC transporter substrate-binding protein [Microvirga sp. P5_D2]